MVIAVDAMGGDYAPREIVKGAIEALREVDIEIAFIGRQEEISSILKEEGDTKKLPIRICHASQVVDMGESPSEVIRQKKDSSIRVALELVKQKKAHGVFSAGNSGATLALAMFILGRLKGVKRPAFAGIIPTPKGYTVMIDVGGVVDCRAYHLVQFAVMGHVFAKYILEISNPRVGLLSIGEESSKGNELIKKTYEYLEKSPLNFVGNIEGKDILWHKADVIVCDGFVGNVALKVGEGVVETLFTLVKKEAKESIISKIGLILAKKWLKRVFNKLDYSEYGGAPLLGINGTVIIGHGRSKAKAVKNGIKMAASFVEKDINTLLQKGLKEHETFMPGKSWRRLGERLKEVIS
ncbi:MAG TPA: phosphate acyltransferase PlsX [Candidatus Desulfofervidus auxilii]|uniref:Phosphate acyltransferase n=1 Tax=Desulfofervidus auxilii TaxID=1621989 RepID=A0A7V0IA39_DESA2|nr:phosphate acyltransferase PlsX [Candidatus Desulfofervidus auxilii]